MKCLCIVIYYYTVITGITAQWPKVNHVKKSAYFPSLEVKIHPPDIYQPQIQMLIQSLEMKRELKEKQLLKQIESAYNNELLSASNTITNIISNALSIFDNNNLFHKSISYALTPPLVVLTKSQRVNNNNNNNGNTRYQSKFKQQNGPITFIETASTASATQYTKPISVRMKIPKEPDISIKHEIERMERKRDELEEQLCKQALIELKLITKITIKELQLNLKHELLPFYSISSNNNITNNIKSVINSNIKEIESRFIQIDNTNTNNNSTIDVIKRTKCIEMKIKYPYININCSDITNHHGNSSSSSFIEKDNNDFINVKFTSNGNNVDSYPTIEKLISQMMTRRDLSEKYIRLKILETESRLQKALSEYIEDTLHDNIYRIISKYAPAIEGLKEHIK